MAENFDPNIIQSNANVLPQYTPQGGALSAPAGALTTAAPAGALTPASPAGGLSMRDMLRKSYDDSQKAAAAALTTEDAASKQYADSQNEKRRVLQASYDKLLAQKPNNSEMLFALGAGLLSPTKTGGLSGFGESIGNAARAIGPAAGRANELRRANEKLGIEYQLGMSGVDTDIANSNTERARSRGAAAAAQGARAVTALGHMSTLEQNRQLALERIAASRSEALARADRLAEAARARSDADTNEFIRALSPEGKTVLANIGGIEAWKRPGGAEKFQEEFSKYMGLAEEPPEQLQQRLFATGVPEMAADPFAGMPIKKKHDLQASTLKSGQDALDKEQPEIDTARKIREDGRRFLEYTQDVSTGSWLYNVTYSELTSDEAKAAYNIAETLGPLFRNGLPGSASDNDVRMFKAGAPSLTQSRKANENLVRGYEANAADRENRHAFKQMYLSQHKTLFGADTAWNRYLRDNPISEYNEEAIAAKNAEAYKLNNARADWQTYFREEARPTKLPPKLEADIIARTPPGEGATLDDGTVWTVANGKVKRVR